MFLFFLNHIKISLPYPWPWRAKCVRMIFTISIMSSLTSLNKVLNFILDLEKWWLYRQLLFHWSYVFERTLKGCCLPFPHLPFGHNLILSSENHTRDRSYHGVATLSHFHAEAAPSNSRKSYGLYHTGLRLLQVKDVLHLRGPLGKPLHTYGIH